MRLDDVRGFVFDVDGTLVRRFPDGVHPLPGAVELLEAIRKSGRPLALFTNGSHVPPEVLARQLRADGLPVADQEMVTPLRSALSHLRRRHASQRVLLFGTDDARAFLVSEGVHVISDGAADVVLVLHTDAVEFPALEHAARAIIAGAPFLTANTLPVYAGANGPIFSRGAMLTAALAKASGARPTVVGKPSRPAVRELHDRLGVDPRHLLVTGDDVRMDVGLGLLGGARTVLVRSGISATVDLSRLPERRRPHAVVEGVHELLAWL